MQAAGPQIDRRVAGEALQENLRNQRELDDPAALSHHSQHLPDTDFRTAHHPVFPARS